MQVVEKVNSLTNKFREICVEFEFDSIHAAYELIHSNTYYSKFRNFYKKNVKTYLIQVFLKPGNVFFESTIRVFDNNKFEVMGDILRINRYGNQSHCIHDHFLEKYCYCKDLI
jgi:hypothetical protein